MWAYRRPPQVDRGGRSHFQILFGVETSGDLPCQPPHAFWVEEQAIRQREAYAQQAARKQERQAAGPQTEWHFYPGDLVTITEGDRHPLSHGRRQGYRITSLRGKVALVQRLPRDPYEQPAAPQPISIDHLRKTAAGTEWPEIGARVTRAQLRWTRPVEGALAKARRRANTWKGKTAMPAPDPELGPRRSQRLVVKPRQQYSELD